MAFSLMNSLKGLLPVRGPRVAVNSVMPGSNAVADKRLSVVEQERILLDDHRKNNPFGRVRVAYGRGIIPQAWFLPYHDNITGETPAMRAAYRLMLRSPTVKSGLYSKVLSVASLDYQIQPAMPDSPRDLEACEFLKFNIGRIPMGMFGLVHSILTHMLIDGYQLTEPVLGVETEDINWRGRIVLHDIKTKHPDLYYVDTDEYASPVAIRGRGPNSGDLWPIGDFIYSRYLPLYDDPNGTSDLRAAYQPYFMRDTVTKLRAVCAEKYTTPFLVGWYVNQDDKGDLEYALARARSETWVAIPEGTRIEAMKVAQGSESDFKSFVDDCDKQTLISIVGAYLQILEGQVADGRGSANVSKTVTELFQWLLAVVFQEVVNKQLFPMLIRYNYPGLGVPRLTLGGVSEEEIAKIIGNLQGAQSLGLKLSQKDAYARLGVQPPLGPEDVLVSLASSMYPQMGGSATSGPFSFKPEGLNGDGGNATNHPAQQPAKSEGDSPDKADVELLNTVGGATSITAIQTAYYANELPRDAAIATATTVFKLTQPEAEKLFPPQTPETLAKASAVQE